MEQVAKRALEAFLSLTSGSSEGELVLRALVLHMLEGYKPEAFRKWKLALVMQDAIHRLPEVSITFPNVLSPDDALARVDATYLLHEQNLPHDLPKPTDFLNYLTHLDQNGFSLYAWVMSELMKSCGLNAPIVFHDRPFKLVSPFHDLYWITHLFLLDTRYLQKPLHNPNASEWSKELIAATPWVLEDRRFDLAAEIGICLQLAAQDNTNAYRMILGALTSQQQSDGSLHDPTLDLTSAAHTTGACLLFFTGVEEVEPV